MEMIEILNFAKTEILRNICNVEKRYPGKPENIGAKIQLEMWYQKLDFLNAEIRKIEAK